MATAATPKLKAGNVRDVDAQTYVLELAAFLKKKGMAVPTWAEYAKTSRSKELAPLNDDWYYVRAAAIARHVFIRPGTGVGGLARYFGDANYRKHVVQSHHCDASRGVIRHCLINLTKIGILEPRTSEKKAKPEGARLTKQGLRELNRVAQTILSAKVASE